MYLGQNTDAGQSRERDMQIMTDEVLFILLEKWSPGTRGQKKGHRKSPGKRIACELWKYGGGNVQVSIRGRLKR